MIERNLNLEKFNSHHKYHIFTFDIWKSQGTEFRRSVLEDFVNWSIKTFHDNENELEEIRENIRYTSREIETATTSILTWYSILISISLPFLPILFPLLIDFLKPIQAHYWILLTTFSIYLIFMLILYPSLDYICSYDKKNSIRKFFISYRDRISKLLITPKQPMDHKTMCRIRETNPTNFEFQFNIDKVLSVVQNDETRVIMVSDNIDRLPSGEIMNYWSLVRSVICTEEYCTGQRSDTNLKIIVPYDPSLIFTNIHQGNNDINVLSRMDNENYENLTPLVAREFF